MLAEMTTLRREWDGQAAQWAAFVRGGHDRFWPINRDRFLTLVPSPGRLTVDIGCGEGRMSRELAGLGHGVLAVDGSRSLCRLALDGGGVSLAVQADAADLPIGDGVADLVVAFMSLQDVDDAVGAIREMVRVLRFGGRLCLAITHPVSSAGSYVDGGANARYVIDCDYFESRRQTFFIEYAAGRVALPHHHRPLSNYFEMLTSAGLLIEVVRELPGGDPDGGARVPSVLHVRSVKMPSA